MKCKNNLLNLLDERIDECHRHKIRINQVRATPGQESVCIRIWMKMHSHQRKPKICSKRYFNVRNVAPDGVVILGTTKFGSLISLGDEMRNSFTMLKAFYFKADSTPTQDEID